MRNKRQLIFLTLFSLGTTLATEAQQFEYLTMDQAVQSATSENRAVQIAKKDEEISAARYKQTDAVYLPQASFSYTALSTNNPLNAFGFKLQQKEITAADFNPALLNNPNATPDFMTKVEVQQPIINMDMIYKRKAALKQNEIYGLATQRTKEYLAFEVQKMYLQLQLAYQGKKVLQSALKTAEAFSKLSNDYYNGGLMQKSDLLNAQLQVSGIQTSLAEIDNNIANASDYLSLLMNKPSGVTYLTDSTSASLSLSDTASVNEERADLKAIKKSIESYNLMLTASKKSYLPRLNAFASYQFNNSAMFKYDASAYLAGVQLNWDIFKGNTTKNKIAEQQLEIEKMQSQLSMQKEQSELQLLQAKRDASNAKFKMDQNRLAAQQAEEALRITENRFQQGLVKATDVLEAQTKLTQKQMAFSEAAFQYNLSIYQIQFLTTTGK